MATYREADWDLFNDGEKRTADETVMAFTLYKSIRAAQIDGNDECVRSLARALGRKPGSVAKKIGNIQSHDANRCLQGKVGLTHGSKFDELVWQWSEEEGDALLERGLDMINGRTSFLTPNMEIQLEQPVTLPVGLEREVTRAERVNQNYFRNTLLKNYDHRCCLTGLSVETLLVASHIKPWAAADAKTERLAADNGLLFNAFHDRAFDRGLITLDRDLRIVVSPIVPHDEVSDKWIRDFEGSRISVPKVMPPALEFIEYHNDCVFKSA